MSSAVLPATRPGALLLQSQLQSATRSGFDELAQPNGATAQNMIPATPSPRTYSTIWLRSAS